METLIKNEVTRDNVLSVIVPKSTNSYKAIPNRELIDLTMDGIHDNGFVLETENYRMGRNGNVTNGEYHLRYGNDQELGLMIAWQNSYDKSVSLKFAIGTYVFICSNGAVVGDMGNFKRKHTGDVQEFTPQTVHNYLQEAGSIYERMVQDKNKMKDIEISKRVQAELLGRLFLEEEIITMTQLGIIHKEIENPSFDYKSEGTVWELYNHCTHAYKADHPVHWMKRHINTHKFFTNEFSL